MAQTEPGETTSHLRSGRFVAWSDTALPDRRDLALLAVEKTRMPMMVSDPRQPDNPIVLANQAFLDLTGYASEEVIGRNCRFLQGPETSAAAIQQIRDDVAAGRDTDLEMLNYRKDGTPFWNALHINPLRDDDGTIVYYFASQQDITHQREMSKIKAAELGLLREVDHRARNALALVQGIVRLSRADDAGEYARAVQGRVEALALAHGLLAEARWQAVQLDRLVADMVRAMALDAVSTDGPLLPISPDHVQPLSLVLHELFDNAQRHGALSVPDGKLDIMWHQAEDKVCIRLIERDGPAPAATRRRGFGLTMINAVASRQLRGEIAFDWQVGGLCSELQIPQTRQN